MLEQELILLGLLKAMPMHGYEIKTKIKEILSLFAGVELKSIYYPLRVLEKDGFLIKHIGKQGRRPQRYIYELTAKGKNRFNMLLAQSFLNFKRPQFTLDLSLYFLHYMKPTVAKRRLRARLLILERLTKSLMQMINFAKKKQPAYLVHILEHNLRMVESEIEFLASLIKTI